MADKDTASSDADAARAAAQAADRAGEQGLLFDDDVAPMPDDVGYRGPTACSAAAVSYTHLTLPTN